MSAIADRLTEVRARIAAAARSAGRDPASVRLIAISKTFPLDLIRDAYAAGQREFGENRVQEALQKIESSADLDIKWHLVGHLQTNKVRKVAPVFATIQSVDSLELLTRLDSAAAGPPKDGHFAPGSAESYVVSGFSRTEQAPAALEVLIQVDLAGEGTKFGLAPDEVPPLLRAAATLRAARVVGLMTMPPIPNTPEDARPWFQRLRSLRDEWLASGVPAPLLRELSMGMSGDFEVAIQEGATIVRVGTAIFGRRTPSEK